MNELNLNGLVRLKTSQFTHGMTLGVFGGRASLSVFDNNGGGGGPIIKFLFSETSLVIFKELLEKLLSDENIKPIEMGNYPYDKETKARVFRAAITLGRDETDKHAYITIYGEKHKDPIMFPFLTDDSIKIGNGNGHSDIPKKALSEYGIKTFLRCINNLISVGCVVTNEKRDKIGRAHV